VCEHRGRHVSKLVSRAFRVQKSLPVVRKWQSQSNLARILRCKRENLDTRATANPPTGFGLD